MRHPKGILDAARYRCHDDDVMSRGHWRKSSSRVAWWCHLQVAVGLTQNVWCPAAATVHTLNHIRNSLVI